VDGTRISFDYYQSEEEENEDDEEEEEQEGKEAGDIFTLDDEESVVSEMKAAAVGGAGAGGGGGGEEGDLPPTPNGGTSTKKGVEVPPTRIALNLSMDRIEIRVLDDAAGSSSYIGSGSSSGSSGSRSSKNSNCSGGWIFAFQHWRLESIRTETAGPSESLLQFYLGSFDIKLLDSNGEHAKPGSPALFRPLLATLTPYSHVNDNNEKRQPAIFPTLVPRNIREEEEEEEEEEEKGDGTLRFRSKRSESCPLSIPDTLTLKLRVFAYPPPPPPQLAGTLDVNVGRRLQLLGDVNAWQRLSVFLQTHTDRRCLTGEWGVETDRYPLQIFPPTGVRDVTMECLGGVVRLLPLTAASAATASADTTATLTLGLGPSSLRISDSLPPSSYVSGVLDPRLRTVIKEKEKDNKVLTTSFSLVSPPSSEQLPVALAPWRLELCMSDVTLTVPFCGAHRQETVLVSPTSLRLYVGIEDRSESPRLSVPEGVWYVPRDTHASLTIALAFPEPLHVYLHPTACQALVHALLPPSPYPRFLMSSKPSLSSFSSSSSSWPRHSIISSSSFHFSGILTCANLHVTLPHSDNHENGDSNSSHPLLSINFQFFQAVVSSKESFGATIQRMHMAVEGVPVLNVGQKEEKRGGEEHRGGGMLLHCDAYLGNVEVSDEVHLQVPLDGGRLDTLAELLHVLLLSSTSPSSSSSPSSSPLSSASLPSFILRTCTWEMQARKPVVLLVSLDHGKALQMACPHLVLKGTTSAVSAGSSNSSSNGSSDSGDIFPQTEWILNGGLSIASRLGAGAEWRDFVPETQIQLLLLAKKTTTEEMMGEEGRQDNDMKWNVEISWSSLSKDLNAYLSSDLASTVLGMKKRVWILARQALPPPIFLSFTSRKENQSVCSIAELVTAERAWAARMKALGDDARQQARKTRNAVNQAKGEVAEMTIKHQEQVYTLQRLVEEKETQRQHALGLHHADFAGYLRVGSLSTSSSLPSSLSRTGRRGGSKRMMPMGGLSGVRAKTLVTLPKLWCVLKEGLLLCYDQPHSFQIQHVLTLSQSTSWSFSFSSSSSSTLQPFTPSDPPSSRLHNRLYALSYHQQGGEAEPLFLVCETSTEIPLWKEALEPYLMITGESTPSHSFKRMTKRMSLLHRISSLDLSASSGSSSSSNTAATESPKSIARFSLKKFGLRKLTKQQQRQQRQQQQRYPEFLEEDNPPSVSPISSCSNYAITSASPPAPPPPQQQQWQQHVAIGSSELRKLVVLIEPVTIAAQMGTDTLPLSACYTLASSNFVEVGAVGEVEVRQKQRSWSVTHTWPTIQAFHQEYIQLWTTALDEDGKDRMPRHLSTGLKPWEAVSYAHKLLIGASRLLEMPHSFASDFERQEQANILERYWRLILDMCPPHPSCLALLQRFLGLPPVYALLHLTPLPPLPPSTLRPHPPSSLSSPATATATCAASTTPFIAPITSTATAANAATAEVTADTMFSAVKATAAINTTLHELEKRVQGLDALITNNQITGALYSTLFHEHHQAAEERSKLLSQQVLQLQQALEEEKQRRSRLEEEVERAHSAREDAVLAMTEVSTDAARKLMEAELRHAAMLRKAPQYQQRQQQQQHRRAHHSHGRHVQSHHHATATVKAHALTATPPPPLVPDRINCDNRHNKSNSSGSGEHAARRIPKFEKNTNRSNSYHHDDGIKPVTTPQQRREQLEELLMIASSNSGSNGILNWQLSSSTHGEGGGEGGGRGGDGRAPSPVMMLGEGRISKAQHYETIFRFKRLAVAREEEIGTLKEELQRAQGKLDKYEQRVSQWQKEGEEGGREEGVEKEEENVDEVLILWRRRVREAENRRAEAERQSDELRAEWRRLLTQINEEKTEVEEGREEGRECGVKKEDAWGRMRGEYCQLLHLVRERAMG